MRRSLTIFLLILALAAAQLACNMPIAPSGATPGVTGTPPTPGPGGPTVTRPGVVTATTGPGATTQPNAPSKTPGGQATCTYKVTFLGDVTIPDNTVIPAGQSFVKTWRVRNDGTCTWGTSGHPLHALAFTSGTKMGAPDEVPLPAKVDPGQTIDISVNMTAPATNGTYTSNWLFRLDGDPSGRHWLGIGASGNQPIYALIKVASGSTASATRVTFPSGATAVDVSGTVSAGESKGFVLAALKDQVLIATLSSATNDAKVKITAADNATLQGYPDDNGVTAMAILPSAQDYTVWVTGGASKTTFSLNITIPIRVKFAPGATSASFDGTVTNHMPVSYVLRAQAGQTLKVVVSGSNMGLTIYGLQDGQPLVRAEGGATTFERTLTLTQDYIIKAVPAVDSTTFTITMEAK